MEIPLTPMEFARRARRLYASREAVIDGDLRHGIERFELSVRIRRDICHPVAGLDTKLLQGVRPAIAAIEELRIAEPQPAIDNRLATGVQSARASSKFHRR